MGLLSVLIGPLAERITSESIGLAIFVSVCTLIAISIVLNVLKQLLIRSPHEPPLVFHWFPFIGSTITYGLDPYKFFFSCRKKYGDVFTFILLGRKTTVFLGTKGNDFILNAKLKDVNAEEVYGQLTTPVFGQGVVYDCPNAKLMEQKKFVKFGLTQQAFSSYAPLIVSETMAFIQNPKYFSGDHGTLQIVPAIAELVLYTASRSLQGKEVRGKFDSTFADFYHDLDMGFAPINFMLPWAPLPHNRRRDYANKKMSETYTDIIRQRKAGGGKKDSEDMIWNLMSSVYKNGNPIPDEEVAHMMIALLMAGQHSSSSTTSWVLLRLAQNPTVLEELLEEQKRVLGPGLPELTHESLQKLELNARVVKETLRMHSPIHSIMRKVKSPMPVDGTPYIIPPSHTLLAAPGVTSNSAEHFPDPETWDPHRWDSSEDPRNQTREVAPEDNDEKVDYGYGLVSKGTGSPYLPFGAGRHRCIGETFAYLQIGAIIATLVRHLKFYNPPGKENVIVDTDYSSLFSAPMRNAVVRWERRGSRRNGEKES